MVLRYWRSIALAAALAASACSFPLALGQRSSTYENNTPMFAPLTGSYSSNQNVAITTSVPGAAIHYTTGPTDASTPNPTGKSPLYSSPIPVTGDGTTVVIKALVVKAGMDDSPVITNTYTIDFSRVSTPSFSPSGGSVGSDVDVTVSSDAGATIYYTTAVPPDTPSTPSLSSTVYSGSIPVHGDGTSLAIAAYAVKSGMKPSTVASATYTVTYPHAAAPTITFSEAPAAAGVYVTAGTITLSTTTPGASVYYTTDGSAPTTASTQATAALSVSAPFTGTRTIRAMAQGGIYLQSAETAVTYSVPMIATDLQPPTQPTTWFTVASDSTGTYRVAGAYSGELAVSTDSGATWSTASVSSNWQGSAMSSDGRYMYAASRTGSIYRSADYGTNWADSGAGSVGGDWYGLTANGAGSTVLASGNAPAVYQGTLYGVTWLPLSTTTGGLAIGLSSDGLYALTSDSGHTGLWVSSTGGAAWTDTGVSQSGTWNGMAVSSDGTYMAAAAYNGDLWTSLDHGATWTQAGHGASTWNTVAMASDGSRIAAGSYGGTLTLGTRSGSVWTWTDLPYPPAMGTTPNFQTIAGDSTLTQVTVGINGGSVWNIVLP